MKAHTSPRKARGASMGAKFRKFPAGDARHALGRREQGRRGDIVATSRVWAGRPHYPTTATPSSSCLVKRRSQGSG